MAVTAVKSSKGSASSGTNATIANLTATAGNSLLVGVAAYMNTTTTGAVSVTRTGDTYTVDIEGNTSAATDIAHVGIASAPNVAAGPATLTGTCSSAQGVCVYAAEAGNMPSSAIKDANSPTINNGTGTSASTNSLTNVTADAIFIALVGSESGSNPATMTAGAGWTDTVPTTTQMRETNGSSFPVSGMAYQIVAATGSKSGAWTVSSADWGGVIAVYKAAGAAAVKPKTLATLGVG